MHFTLEPTVPRPVESSVPAPSYVASRAQICSFELHKNSYDSRLLHGDAIFCSPRWGGGHAGARLVRRTPLVESVAAGGADVCSLTANLPDAFDAQQETCQTTPGAINDAIVWGSGSPSRGCSQLDYLPKIVRSLLRLMMTVLADI